MQDHPAPEDAEYDVYQEDHFDHYLPEDYPQPQDHQPHDDFGDYQ